jgi:hypothetical protein
MGMWRGGMVQRRRGWATDVDGAALPMRTWRMAEWDKAVMAV